MFLWFAVAHFVSELEECAFLTSDVYNNHYLWSCQKVCDALVYLLDNIFIRFGTKKGKRKVQGVPQSQTAALPRPQEEEETDKSKLDGYASLFNCTTAVRASDSMTASS